jgi:hemolysin activation/secretion protein
VLTQPHQHPVHRLLIALALTAALANQSPQAQTAPNAGSLQQQIERERANPLPRRSLPARPDEPRELAPPSGPTITVRRFTFAGNTLLPSAQLQALVADFLDRPLSFAELQRAPAAIANQYRQAGWIVRAYLPGQQILDGVVTIQVVEAVFGGAQIEGPPPERVSLATVLRPIETQQVPGQPLNAEAVARALLLADDLPGVSVSGGLREGKEEGETELAIRLTDEPLISGDVSSDNAGARSTGRQRQSANLILNSLLGLGDSIAMNAIHSQGSDYLRLSASLPLGGDGWRVGVNTSHLDYRLISSEFSSLYANGTADSVGLEASYPVIRSHLRNLYLNFNLDRRHFDNQSAYAITSRYKSTALSVGLSGNLYDKLGGGGANSASLTLIGGTLDLDDSPTQSSDASTTQTDGLFHKLRYSVSRTQVLDEVLSLSMAISGQLADRNLDASEKFYLGGPSGVRAYPVNEGSGSYGQLINLELRYRLPLGFTLSVFTDHGRVQVNRNNSYSGASSLNSYSMKGRGVSLAWQPWREKGYGPSLKLTYARRIGENPNPASTGLDQDGSLLRERLWLSAELPI